MSSSSLPQFNVCSVKAASGTWELQMYFFIEVFVGPSTGFQSFTIHLLWSAGLLSKGVCLQITLKIRRDRFHHCCNRSCGESLLNSTLGDFSLRVPAHLSLSAPLSRVTSRRRLNLNFSTRQAALLTSEYKLNEAFRCHGNF